jgi:hypothetical protein
MKKPARTKAKAKAATRSSKAPAKKAAAKTAGKAASRPAKSGRAPAVEAPRDRGRYTPQDISGPSWAPFRYPPA